MTTFTVETSSPFTASIFVNGELRCLQPWNVDASPWQSEEQARAWALERAQQGADLDGWPPVDPSLVPVDSPAVGD